MYTCSSHSIKLYILIIRVYTTDRHARMGARHTLVVFMGGLAMGIMAYCESTGLGWAGRSTWGDKGVTQVMGGAFQPLRGADAGAAIEVEACPPTPAHHNGRRYGRWPYGVSLGPFVWPFPGVPLHEAGLALGL
jgi:hypothetical protein